MKRLVFISVAGILTVGVSATLVLRYRGGGQDATSGKTSSPTAMTGSPRVSSPSPSPSPRRSPAVQATAAPCEPDAMLPVIRAQVPIGTPGVFFDSVDILECQMGYARAAAIISNPNPTPGTHLEPSEQVFLRDAGGRWTVLSSGSGIFCLPPFTPAAMKDACDALGLPTSP